MVECQVEHDIVNATPSPDNKDVILTPYLPSTNEYIVQKTPPAGITSPNAHFKLDNEQLQYDADPEFDDEVSTSDDDNQPIAALFQKKEALKKLRVPVRSFKRGQKLL